MSDDKGVEKTTKLALTGWAVLAFNALGTSLVALRYALPKGPFPTPLPNYDVRHGWLIAHAVFSSLALLAGPWQFLSAFRRRSIAAHRWLGRVYCVAVIAGWLTSLPIAAHAQTGEVAAAGFLTLGAVWIFTTAVAYLNICRRRVQAHREWMMRSYALTAAAITLRMYLPVLLISGIPLAKAYPLVAWICWIPNLCSLNGCYAATERRYLISFLNKSRPEAQTKPRSFSTASLVCAMQHRDATYALLPLESVWILGQQYPVSMMAKHLSRET